MKIKRSTVCRWFCILQYMLFKHGFGINEYGKKLLTTLSNELKEALDEV